jgi:hypothetical protein
LRRLREEEGIRRSIKMRRHYIVEQNPNIVNGAGKRYLVKRETGEKIGLRNKYGIIALKPEHVAIRKVSFSDEKSLNSLLRFLEKRNISNVLY